MNEHEERPAIGADTNSVPDPGATPSPVRRRRRKPRKPPYKALAIFAAVWFVLGMLFGFLLRGCFIAEPDPAPPETTGPSASGTETTTTAPAARLPEGIEEDDWRLILVNKWNGLEDGYSVRLTELPNGMQVDERCYADLMDMLKAIEAGGMTPIVCSAYRSLETQEELFSSKTDELMGEGLSRQEAEAEAGTVVAVPGTSEHHLGLAVDIVDMDNQLLDKSQEDTAVQKWLMEHSWEYGFILRYPNGKSDITGIIYEPWHYRYVGKEVAKDVQQRGLCFEEYLELMIR